MGLLIALTASILTLGAREVLVGPAGQPVASAAARRTGGGVEFENAIARLKALLESERYQSVERISSPADSPAARRVVAGPPVVADTTQEILDRLAAIERKLSVRPTVVRELQPLDRLRAPDLEAIRAAVDLKKADREASEFDLHMRTMQEIVERFGYPSEAAACGGDNCDVFWKYEVPSTDPENSNRFSVVFQGGLVVWTEVSWSD